MTDMTKLQTDILPACRSNLGEPAMMSFVSEYMIQPEHMPRSKVLMSTTAQSLPGVRLGRSITSTCAPWHLKSLLRPIVVFARFAGRNDDREHKMEPGSTLSRRHTP